MKHKSLLNLLPIVVILTIVATTLLHHWQDQQASRPGYDAPAVEQPGGIVNGASSRQMPQTEVWQLSRVTDGDTIVVRQGSREEKIRLCGIDAPEKAQPMGEQSTAFLTQLVNEAPDKIGIVPVEHDRYGRLVAEVFVLGKEEKSVQAEMLMQGMAYVYPQYVGDCWNGEVMKRAEAIGQEQKAGVWSGNYQRPWDYRKQKA